MDRRRWSLKKEVSVGDLVAFIVAAVGVVVAYSTLDKRITLMEETDKEQRSRDAQQDAERLELKKELKEDTTDIKRKLDWLIERRPWGERR